MNSYFRIRLSQVPAHLEDPITTHCFEWGALGVSEALSYSQPDLTYDPEILHHNTHEMDIFFEKSPDRDFFEGLTAYHPNIKWRLFEEEHKDWLEEWKKGFTAFKLVQDIWIVPSWLQPPPEAQTSIYIDPGMAFGTGTHATTQLAAALIYKIHQKNKERQPLSMVDVGTGTAILALLAEHLGFNPIMGVEIDPEARRVAKENVVKNKAKNILILDEQLEDLRENFDVVVANIIDGVLVRIRDLLLRSLKPQGFLIVTGILKERDNEFFEDFTRGTSLKVIRRIEKDEWVGYWFQDESSKPL
jgi:ribosomal protein L11 methyltransferase